MNTFQKEVKKVMSTKQFNVYPDRVINKRDGTIELRHGFFYRHGQTSEMWKQKVVDGLSRGGVTVNVVKHEEVWQAWPKDSYWTVTIGAVENGQPNS